MANLEVVKEKTSSEKTRIDNIHKELAWGNSYIHVLQMHEFVLYVNFLIEPKNNDKIIEIKRKVLRAFRNDKNEVLDRLKSYERELGYSLSLKNLVTYFCRFKSHEQFYTAEEICKLGETFVNEENGKIDQNLVYSKLNDFADNFNIMKDDQGPFLF